MSRLLFKQGSPVVIGNLVNVSTGGFAVESTTLPLSNVEEFMTEIIFVNEEFTTDEFTVKAKL